MVRLIAIAAMLAGVGDPNTAVAQPSPQIKQAPDVFFYSPAGRSYLGVDIQDVTADRLSALKLKEERGVEVTMVDQDAPAGKAGIKEHDVILEFNGTAVESEEQLRRLIREIPPGRTVTLGISRDGNPMKISVQLGDRGKIVAESQPKIVIPKIPRVEIPPIEGPSYNYQFQVQQYSSVLGVQTENLTRQLGEFFGVKDGEGVLVRSVEKGSAAEKAGIKAGDVIVRADNEKLSDRTDLTRILRNHRDGGKLPLVIVREKREQTVVVELPARNSRGWWDNFDSGWFDSDELKGWGDEMEKWLEEIEPEIEHARDIAATHVKSQLTKAQQQVRPQIDKAMRQAQRELERSRRLLEEQQRQLKKRLNDWV